MTPFDPPDVLDGQKLAYWLSRNRELTKQESRTDPETDRNLCWFQHRNQRNFPHFSTILQHWACVKDFSKMEKLEGCKAEKKKKWCFSWDNRFTMKHQKTMCKQLCPCSMKNWKHWIYQTTFKQLCGVLCLFLWKRWFRAEKEKQKLK